MNHQVVIAVVVLRVKLYHRPRVRRGKYAPACRRRWAGKSPKMSRIRHKTGECVRKQTNYGTAGTSFYSGVSVLDAPGQFTAVETSDDMYTITFRVTDSVTVFGGAGMRGASATATACAYPTPKPRPFRFRVFHSPTHPS